MISHTSAEYVACLAGEMREMGRECRDGKRGGEFFTSSTFPPFMPCSAGYGICTGRNGAMCPAVSGPLPCIQQSS